MANILLHEEDSTAQPIGKNWVSSFIKRHDEVKSRFARRYNYSRAKCEDPRTIKAWFKQLEEVRKQWGIQDEDIFNFDETGFAMGLIATTKVVTRASMPGKPHLIQPGNREWVTTIECMNSSGWMVPSCIIFKGKRLIEGWFEEYGIPVDWRIELSANGWTTNEIGLRWLEKTFIPATATRRVGGYQLLVLDGHGSHLTPQFDRLCKKHNIVPICMPPHSSHLLQPLDVGCFGPLKRAYGGLVEAKMRLGYNHIDKFDFLDAYPTAHQKVFTPQNVSSGFAAAGILPFEPQQVFDKLNISMETPTPPSSRGGGSIASSLLATPHTAHQLFKKASSIKKMLWQRSESPSSPSKQTFNELLKGCELIMHQTAFMAKELHDLRAENEKTKQKKSRSRRLMTPDEGLSIQEARDLIAQRNQHLNDEGGPSTSSTPITSIAPRRAPPTCSECHIKGHTRTS
jgi:hypothetical protein